MVAGTGTFTRAAGIRLLDQAESAKGLAKPISLRGCVSNVILIEPAFWITLSQGLALPLCPRWKIKTFSRE